MAAREATMCEELFKSESAESWKSWVETASDKSASVGHKFIKQHEKPEFQSDFDNSTCRSVHLRKQVSAWSSLWTHDTTFVPSFARVPCLPDLDIQQVRRASLSFKSNTCDIGGLHPRHVALLSDDAITMHISILHFAEAIGFMPAQAAQLVVVLIPKTDGGARPIGLFQAVFRIWAQMRKQIVQQWEQEHARQPFFAAMRQRSALDVAWRHTLTAEMAKGTNMFFGAILMDLDTAYERVDHEDLIKYAGLHRYPMALLRLSIAAYRAARHLSMNGITSNAIYANRGIIAGSAFAVYELKLVLITLCKRHDRNFPDVRLTVYIDDIIVDATSKSKQDLVTDLADSANALVADLTQFAHCKIAAHKTQVVANDLAIAQSVSRSLRGFQGSVCRSVRNLGVDLSPGRAFKGIKAKVRGSRFKRIAGRLRKLQLLAKAQKKIGTQLFFCGLWPAVNFDNPVYGLFGKALRAFRGSAAKALGLKGPKRSTDLGFAFHRDKDPEILGAVAPLQRLLSEIWMAALPARSRNPCVISLGTLAAGISACTDSAELVDERCISGPISASFVSLKAIGWKFTGPFSITDHNGKVLHLLQLSPKYVCNLFRDTYANVIVQRAIVKLHKQHMTLETLKLVNQGLFLRPLLSLHKRLPASQARVLCKIVSNGIMTGSTFFGMGYSSVDPACQKCGNAFDTVSHRCFLCVEQETKLMQTVDPNVINRIFGDNKALLTARLLFPKPIVKCLPVDKTYLEFVNLGPDDFFTPDGGEVFADGSCLWPKHPELARAGFSVVQVDDAGEVIKAVYGALGRSYPQSPLAAEYAGMSVAHDNSAQCDLVMDCAAVISLWRRGFGAAMQSGTAFDHWWKEVAARHRDPGDRIKAIHKVKAHQSIGCVPDNPVDIRRFYGNDHADRLAKLGADLQPVDQEECNLFLQNFNDIMVTAKFMVDQLCADPPGHFQACKVGKKDRHKRGTRTGLSSLRSHDFHWVNTSWTCAKCLMRTKSPLELNAVSPCPGASVMMPIFNACLGHRIWRSPIQGGGHVYFCSICWCHAECFPKRLKQKCQGPPCTKFKAKGFGRIAKARIVALWHPNGKRRIYPPVRIV